MKNKKVLFYINLIIIVFSAMALGFNLIQCRYFSVIASVMAFLTILLTLISIVILNSEEKQIKVILKSVNDESERKKSESIETTEANVENNYLKLVSDIDPTLELSALLNQKIQRIANPLQAVGALIYTKGQKSLHLTNAYALIKSEYPDEIELGNGITGQVAIDGNAVAIDLKDQMQIEIISGLGKAKPNFVYILPVFNQQNIVAVIELATFVKLSEKRIEFLIEALRTNGKS